MTFDELDARMRALETAADAHVAPGVYGCMRVDGRSFTRLTAAEGFAKPFDARFRDLMAATAERLMSCGFRALYGYTQSDEISVLLAPGDEAFGRKTRKLVSVFAGEASATFTHLLGRPAAFDARVCPLRDEEQVLDYFRWRAEDARRNAINGRCWWALREQGRGGREAADLLRGLTAPEKLDLLASAGVLFEATPAWQRNGVGVLYETVSRDAVDPRTGGPVVAVRRRLRRELELPAGEAYSAYLRQLLRQLATGS